LSEDGAEPGEIIASPTVLYRNLVDLTCGGGGKFVDSGEPVEHEQFRLTGGRLRDLLRRTATALTVTGKENISYLELRLRLKGPIDDLEKTVEQATGDNVLSQLMISYFFKGGHEDLGCEFLHKSFREYLFAEGVVETLKQYGRAAMKARAERDTYWRDFDAGDARYGLSRALASQLASQWLRPEVVSHLEGLLEWEVGRAAGVKALSLASGQPTVGVELREWEFVRDALADLWDWWAEGVHLRPQPQHSRRDVALDPPYAQELVEISLPVDVPRGTIPEPPRIVVADAHLGDALFRLNAWTHFLIAKGRGWLEGPEGRKTPEQLWASSSQTGEGPRRYQTRAGDGFKLFAPSGRDAGYWTNYVARINAAGWRPQNVFPLGCNLSGVDLRGSWIGAVAQVAPAVDWSFANLSRCDASFGGFYEHVFSSTLLRDVQLVSSSLVGARFFDCELGGATIILCTWYGAKVLRSSLTSLRSSRSDFTLVEITGCDLSGASFENCSFVRAKITGSSIDGATFGGPVTVQSAVFHELVGNPNLGGAVLITDKKTELPLAFDAVRRVTVEATGRSTKSPRRQTK
jgi:uncharacterized protein YjbI with pentapeptide repeats